jgi:3-oxoacyl-[acyl-carrier protein] reductase
VESAVSGNYNFFVVRRQWMMSDLLNGKVALITGASKGIGRALSIGYAATGASVVCAARSKDLLDQVVNEIHQAGGQALAIEADVTLESDVDRMLTKTVAHFGKLDILVLNAGGNLEGNTVEGSDPSDWQKTIDLNLIGPYYCARAAVPYLKQNQGGKIITLGSGLGHRGIAGMSAYACSKAGLWMLTRVLAQELQPYNISVNELIPGPVDTGVISKIFRETVLEKQDEWVKTPEDVVSMALFLASQPDLGPTAQSFSLMRRDN